MRVFDRFEGIGIISEANEDGAGSLSIGDSRDGAVDADIIL